MTPVSRVVREYSLRKLIETQVHTLNYDAHTNDTCNLLFFYK